MYFFPVATCKKSFIKNFFGSKDMYSVQMFFGTQIFSREKNSKSDNIIEKDFG